ncbi:hypothetical protein A2159_00705 [Candidatus Woesebacteria bacterium RBG_13_34_9]|uniref:50S ribosomal protein L29 n=1 Tax=Candidatus Woesebacteria bacterium RBG_13_34_9 TaxID=1802477 RepID=A0A1F7X2W7_9BACT|nr:MAG: hypothetical protein A2159_00705 [Candidatus Woesebacteria bacterium RBG_13_34_9]
MKKKELENFRLKAIKDLEKIISEKKIDFIRVSAEMKVGKEKNLKKAKNLRHEISQLKTLLRQKVILQAETEDKKK